MKIFSLLSVLLFTGAMFSQETGGIRGHITDQDSFGEPLLYAEVVLKDQGKKTQANLHGNFEIHDVAPGNYTLMVSYLGYETEEIPLEVKENEITEIHTSLATKTLDMDLMALLAEDQKEKEKPASGLPKE